jgi:hypothetical protein
MSLLTGNYEETANNKVQINLASIFGGTEATSVFKNWLYGKILSVTITFWPNNLNTSNDPLYMVIVWVPELPLYLSQMNNVKIVPAFRTGFKSYTFAVPLVECGSLLLRKFKSVLDFPNSEFYLYLHSPGNTDKWKFRVDIKMLLKGAKILEQPSTLIGKEIIEEKDNKEIKEEEKEEMEIDKEETEDQKEEN